MYNLRSKEKLRKTRQYLMRKSLKNHDFTLFCNNCVAGLVYHDLSMRFNSPTINLFIKPAHYVKMLKMFIEFWSELLEIAPSLVRELPNDKESYPVGMIGKDIGIHFLHYHSFIEGMIK